MSLKDQVVAALKKVYDPEMPINIYELGLIYDVAVDDDAAAVGQVPNPYDSDRAQLPRRGELARRGRARRPRRPRRDWR